MKQIILLIGIVSVLSTMPQSSIYSTKVNPAISQSEAPSFDNMNNIDSYQVNHSVNVPAKFKKSTFYVLEIPYIFTDTTYYLCYEKPKNKDSKGYWVCFAKYYKISKTWAYDSDYLTLLTFK